MPSGPHGGGSGFKMRSERDFELILFRFRFHSRMVLKPGEGARALRFALDRLQ